MERFKMDLIGGAQQPAIATPRGAAMPPGCESCPAPGAICGPERCPMVSAVKGELNPTFSAVSKIADFALLKSNLKGRELKTPSESSVTRESSGAVVTGGGGGEYLKCEECHASYRAGTSCKHESGKKAA